MPDQLTWGTQSDWEASTRDGVVVDGDVVRLGETVPDPVVIDDFEDEDYFEYDEDEFDWSFETGSPLEGAASAEPPTSTASQIYSDSGLPTYPERGSTIRVRFRSDGSDRSNNDDGFGWALQSGSMHPEAPGYAVTLAPDNTGSDFGIAVDDFDNPVVTDPTVSVPDGQAVEIEIVFDDPTITARLYDGLIADGAPVLSELSVDDASYDAGGIAFMQNSGAPSADPLWDYARVLPGYIAD